MRLKAIFAPGIAKNQASLYVEYDLPWVATQGLTATARVLHYGESYYNAANTQILPEWTRLDIGARYAFMRAPNKPVTIRANIENGTGIRYWAAGILGALTVGSPRTYLVSAQFDF